MADKVEQTLKDGNYYLKRDLTLSSSISVGLCLNYGTERALRMREANHTDRC